MRVTVRILGIELLATYVNLYSPQESESEFDEYQDAGSTTSTPVGFTLPDVPLEAECQHVFEGDPED